MEVVLASKARSDIASILQWTLENFGDRAMQRYSKLVRSEIEEVAANPEVRKLLAVR